MATLGHGKGAMSYDFQVLVDSDAFVGSLYPQDPHHDHAQKEKMNPEISVGLMILGPILFIFFLVWATSQPKKKTTARSLPENNSSCCTRILQGF